MPRYVIDIGHDITIEQPIEARDLSEAASLALTAMAEFVAAKQPPPSEMRIIVMDASRQALATIHFACLQ